MKKGLYLKIILAHNIIFVDLLFTACLLVLWRQGHTPNTLIKYAVIFYGAEGILGAAIKIFKEKTKDKKKKEDSLEE